MSKIYNCFPGGVNKVLTMSYDDGKQEDIRLIRIFNKYGIKGTFHLNSGLIDMDIRIKPERWQELYRGHEVAAHTYTHPTIARLPMEQVTKEVLEDRKFLEKTMGYPIRGLSYPNGSYNSDVKKLLPLLGIKYSRIVGNSDNFNMVDDFYEWLPTCHHNHRLLELGKEFAEHKKKQYMIMMYVWGHSYEFERDNNWGIIEEFCEIVAHKDDIWYATNIQIVDYMEVLDRLQFSADGTFVYNPSVASAWISVDDVVVEIKGGELKYL